MLDAREALYYIPLMNDLYWLSIPKLRCEDEEVVIRFATDM